MNNVKTNKETLTLFLLFPIDYIVVVKLKELIYTAESSLSI